VLVWVLAGLFVACARLAPGPTDPLPSWNAGSVKASIVDFVRRVTMQDGAEFVPPAARIAVFDNDGTLWSEQPMYFQLTFAIDRVRALAPQHPEWRTRQPFKAVLDGDLRALAASGDKGLIELLMVTHTGMTTDEFAKIVADWIATACPEGPSSSCASGRSGPTAFPRSR
jgi:hypothetical protein